ncbi:MAG TPA: methyltransferase domain-containing protein [Steroidobacteraceae bacterium]|nr:methyltransferase domain-containing protein [Steroidobacteraceae bacterium]
MTFTLNDVVPWGRNLEEYCAMFALGETERGVSILGCADGPASFNAEGTASGMRIVSVDPLYNFSTAQIRARIEEATPGIAEQTRRNAAEFVWNQFPDVDALIVSRQNTMELFLADYDAGIAQGRYASGSAIDLPFPDHSFDLALCSHFLFLYSAQHDLAFHLKALRELARVADEIRVFPLLELGTVESRHLRAVMLALPRMGLKVERRRVPYELQRGGNEMLVICR